MKKRQRKVRLIRAAIQLVFFIFYPALFSTAFAGVKSVFQAIAAHQQITWNSFLDITGLLLLVLILIGMCTQERFFCQFLCPMGAVFAMIPILPSALFNRNREKCPSKCGLCRKRCPAHLEIDGDTPLSGECICCHACQVTCPRKNIQIGPVKEREMVKE